MHQLHRHRPPLGLLDRQGADSARSHAVHHDFEVKGGDDIYKWMEDATTQTDHVETRYLATWSGWMFSEGHRKAQLSGRAFLDLQILNATTELLR